MSEQNPGTDGFQSEEHREPTILGKKIKHDDFDHLMGFYEADHKLTTDERLVMSRDLAKSGLTTMVWALLDSSIVVWTPLLYRRYKERKLGAGLPALVRLPTIFRLMFFLAAGLGVYFWSSTYHAKNNQQYRIASLEADCSSGRFSEKQVESKQRMLDVWKALDASELSLFTMYYFKTASNPSLAMKSPKDMVSFDPHAVVYMPSPVGKEGSLRSVFGAVKEHETLAPHWEILREVNGFVPPKSEDLGTDSLSSSATECFLVSDDPNQNSSMDLENESLGKKRSAWERLRKGN